MELRDERAVNHLLGELEAAVMRQMWSRERASVREILNQLNDDGRALAYTTVLTVMNRLSSKGLLERELIGKTHIYRATTNRDAFLRQAAAQRVQDLIEAFGDLAIAQFLREVAELSPQRRRQLRRLAGVEEGR
jgi:predicted transcriptional regulator